MRKYAAVAALLAAMSGVFGFILRRSQLVRAFEPDTGLVVSGSPSTIAFMLYIALVFAAAVLLSVFIRRSYTARRSFHEAYAPTGAAYLAVAGVIAAALVFGGGSLAIRTQSAQRLDFIAAVGTVLSGLCIFGLAMEQYRKRDFKASLLYAVIPELTFAFWMFITYRTYQTNPIRFYYAFRFIAPAAAAVAFYFQTAAVYGRPTPSRLVLSHVSAIFFLAVACADAVDLERLIIFGALFVYFTVNLARALANLEALSQSSAEASETPTEV